MTLLTWHSSFPFVFLIKIPFSTLAMFLVAVLQFRDSLASCSEASWSTWYILIFIKYAFESLDTHWTNIYCFSEQMKTRTFARWWRTRKIEQDVISTSFLWLAICLFWLYFSFHSMHIFSNAWFISLAVVNASYRIIFGTTLFSLLFFLLFLFFSLFFSLFFPFILFYRFSLANLFGCCYCIAIYLYPRQ